VLAKDQRDVLALEAASFPRFHVGESVMPSATPLWKRLGLWEKLEGTGFARKGGADFLVADGSAEARFWFARYLPGTLQRTMQVDRAKFDALLMAHAREAGAEIREGVRVTDVEPRGDGVEVAWRAADGRTGTEKARVVMDCSGMKTVLARKWGLRRPVEGMRRVAVFAHYENIRLPEGERAGNTEILGAADAWYWLIPMTIEKDGRNTASVGVVVERGVKDAWGGTALEMMERLLDAAPLVRERLRGAKRITEAHVEADFSYRCEPACGDGWGLIGDAAAFLDPIFSTGLYLAQRHAEDAALSVARALRRPGLVPARAFAAPAARHFRAVDIYTRFVRAFYTQEFYDIFVSERRAPGVRKAVVRVLAGDVGGMNLFLRLFFWLVAAQRRWGIVPRVPLPRFTGCLQAASQEAGAQA
jgi:FADH2-dependent halogenase